MTTAALQTIPVLRAMDAKGFSGWKAAICIFAVVISTHALMYLLGEALLTEALPEGLSVSEFHVMYLLMGVATSVHLSCVYAINRHLQIKTESELAFVDDIDRYRVYGALPGYLVLILPMVISAVVLLATDQLIDGYPVEWRGLLMSGFFLFIFPANLAAGGLLMIAAISAIRYTWHVAKGATISLFRLPAYGCVAQLSMLVLAALSIILSLLGAMYLLIGEASAMKEGLGLMFYLTFIVAIPAVAGSFLPIWVMQRRIEIELQDERATIVEHLESLTVSANPGSAGSEAALLTKLAYVDSLSSWPVGTLVKRFVVIGLLPPFTWMMAAIIENIMFS